MKFNVVSGKTIAGIIDRHYEQVISIISDAYSAFYKGNTIVPDSYFLRFPKKPSARIIALPAHIDDGIRLSGIKWISSFPSNLDRGIPRASAVLVLNDYETGFPIACMEASIISATRTAASAVLAAQHLNGGKKVIESLGIIGTGLISRYVLKFLIGSSWQIKHFHLFDLKQDYAQQFKKRMVSDYALDQAAITVHVTAEDAIASSEVIALATTSAEPYLHSFECFSHNPIALHISLRDIAPEIILKSYNVVDDIDHCLKAATSPHLAQQKVGHHDFIHSTLPQLIAGYQVPKRDKPVIFSPFGMGVLDLALGYFVYTEAMNVGNAITVPGFFHEMARV